MEINPDRVRKTQKATSHAAALDPSIKAKGKKAGKDDPKKPSLGMTRGEYFSYFVLSMIIYACIFGWIFGYPVFETIIGKPFGFVFSIFTWPFRAVWRLIASGFSLLMSLTRTAPLMAPGPEPVEEFDAEM
ncbi:hypothetical protein HDU97_010380 [Phlyctochytrium planicorne]|nr:hypothetical protein HDU97_010380 [Phlyctochytrium planicorne]